MATPLVRAATPRDCEPIVKRNELAIGGYGLGGVGAERGVQNYLLPVGAASRADRKREGRDNGLSSQRYGGRGAG